MSDYIERDKIFSVWRSIPAPASLTSLATAISQTPSADVAPVRHGRWTPADQTGDCCYTCSECGFERDAYLLDVGNYCPVCGARMDKEDAPTLELVDELEPTERGDNGFGSTGR